jgi:hypothetical protein
MKSKSKKLDVVEVEVVSSGRSDERGPTGTDAPATRYAVHHWHESREAWFNGRTMELTEVITR